MSREENRGTRVVPREHSRPHPTLRALVHLLLALLLLSSVSRRVLGKLIPIKASRYATVLVSRRGRGEGLSRGGRGNAQNSSSRRGDEEKETRRKSNTPDVCEMWKRRLDEEGEGGG